MLCLNIKQFRQAHPLIMVGVDFNEELGTQT